jgi:Flp pilus assembly protein TadG
MLPSARRFRLFRGPARSRAGSTATEFAIIAVPLLSFIVFLIEGSFQLLTLAMLQYGLREATRFGVTGQSYPPGMVANPPASREAAIKQIIAACAPGLINASYLTVTVTAYSSFAAVGVAGQGTAGNAGSAQAIVLYQVSYYQPWLLSGPAYLPVLATGLTGLEHTLSAVVQNEDFPSN